MSFTNGYFDQAVEDYVAKVGRLMYDGHHREVAMIRVLKEAPAVFHEHIKVGVTSSFGTAFPRRPAVKAKPPQTIRVLLAVSGDRGEFREVRLPPRHIFAKQFHIKNDEDMCKAVMVLSHIPDFEGEDKQRTTTRSGRKIDKNAFVRCHPVTGEPHKPFEPAKIGPGDIIYLPNGKCYLIQTFRKFRELAAHEFEHYMSWPQDHRHSHPLMRG